MNILLVESSAMCKTLLRHLGKNEWQGGFEIVEEIKVQRKNS